MRLHRGVQITLIVCLAVSLCAVGGAVVSSQPVEPSAAAPIAARLYHPHFLKDYYGLGSTLYLANPSESPANAVLDFQSGGTFFSDAVGPIPPHGVLRRTGADVPGLPPGFYTLVVSSDQPVQSVVRTERASTAQHFHVSRPSGGEYGPAFWSGLQKRGWLERVDRDLEHQPRCRGRGPSTYVSNDGTPVGTRAVSIPAFMTASFIALV